MNASIYNKTKENVARALCVPSFSDAAKIDEKSRDAMIAKAQKQIKIKCNTKTKDLSSGNPYIMLGRKVNSEGKRVK